MIKKEEELLSLKQRFLQIINKWNNQKCVYYDFIAVIIEEEIKTYEIDLKYYEKFKIPFNQKSSKNYFHNLKREKKKIIYISDKYDDNLGNDEKKWNY